MMNYEFPIIETIDDVLPHIKGRDEFIVNYNDHYTVIKYVVAFKETFEWDYNDLIGSAIRRECRGLIFDVNGEIISRSYHKFFNVGERDETQNTKINLYEPHVILEKLDGSMIRPVPLPKGFRLATKFGITDFSMSAEAFIADKKNYGDLIHHLDSFNMTPIFEWITPNLKQRIVIQYTKDNLILTGIRHFYDGKYVSYSKMKQLADDYQIPCVQVINGVLVENIEILLNQIRNWEDAEGVVIRFDDGHMCKIKADDYVIRHKIKSTFNQEKSILELIIKDRIDDVIPLLYITDAERLQRFHHLFWGNIKLLENVCNTLYQDGVKKYSDRKDFAVYYVQEEIESKFVPIMYDMKSGKSAKECILTMITKSLSSQTKINSNRWLFGDINWNNTIS